MEGAVCGRFRIVAEEAKDRVYVVQLYGADGADLGVVFWSMDDLGSGPGVPRPPGGNPAVLREAVDAPVDVEHQAKEAGCAAPPGEVRGCVRENAARREREVPHKERLDATTGVSVQLRLDSPSHLKAGPGHQHPPSSIVLRGGWPLVILSPEPTNDFVRVRAELEGSGTAEGWVRVSRLTGDEKASRDLASASTEAAGSSGHADVAKENWWKAEEEAAVRRWHNAGVERELDRMESVTIRVLPAAGIYLRVAPREGADQVGPQLRCGTPVVVEAMETLQGHVRVEVDMGRLNEGTEEVVKGWACVADLQGEKEGHVYRMLTSEEWWQEPWTIQVAETSIWVRASGRNYHQILEEITLMGEADKNTQQRRKLFAENLRNQRACTYVALALGRPRKGAWTVCSEQCHVTIAYAAWMNSGEMDTLREILTDMLRDWRWLEPEERPRTLVRCRTFDIQTREDNAISRKSSLGTGPWQRGRIATMSWDAVESLLREKRVEAAHLPLCTTLRDLAERTWARDVAEMRDAARRAKGLRSTWMLEGLLYMEKASDGLGNSRELADLLYYLSNAIMHYASAFERLNGRLVSPCLTDPDHWHMSWQCGWLRARQDVLNEMDEGMGHCGWGRSRELC